MLRFALAALVLAPCLPAQTSWGALGDAERREAERFAEEFKAFLHVGRTEDAFTAEGAAAAEAAGFKPWTAESDAVPGGKYYFSNRGRTLIAFVLGKRPVREGLRVVGTHIDSPHLDLKGRPIRTSGTFLLLQTMPHGGLKTYQWVNRPLALLGRVYKTDGSVVEVSVGLDADDPVLVIPDLAPHVDVSQRERKARAVVGGEEMDPIALSRFEESEGELSERIAAHLKERYDVALDDLVSAELNIVPAERPRDVGLDRALVGAYGLDDRAGSYPALRALLETESPELTAVAYLTDNEESGSNNNTGARSSAFNDLVAEIIHRQEGEGFHDVMVRRALRATYALSVDMNPGLHPIWPSSLESENAPRVGAGISFKLYGRGVSPNAEFVAKMRALLADEKLPWQVMTYKVGAGGGGTIGGFLSDDNMEVMDIGLPILSMHSPMELVAKSDVFVLYRALAAFYQSDWR